MELVYITIILLTIQVLLSGETTNDSLTSSNKKRRCPKAVVHEGLNLQDSVPSR